MNQDSTGSEQDWVSQAINTLESGVDAIRSKTSEPLAKIVQAVVFGMLALGVGILALLLLTIGAVRALDAYLPQGVWMAYLVIGAVFTLVGFALWRLRHNPQS